MQQSDLSPPSLPPLGSKYGAAVIEMASPPSDALLRSRKTNPTIDALQRQIGLRVSCIMDLLMAVEGHPAVGCNAFPVLVPPHLLNT